MTPDSNKPQSYVIGDIHGGLAALIELISKIDLNHTKTIYFTGDYVDGWSQSFETINYLLELKKRVNCVFLKGNHDELCLEWLLTGELKDVWVNNGGDTTIKSYAKASYEDKQKHISFFSNLLDCFMDEEKRLFVHAGFTSHHGHLKEKYTTNFYYDRTLWECALAAESTLTKDSPFFPKRLSYYSEVFIGHTNTDQYNLYEPVNRLNLWNVDTGAGYTGKLSMLNIDSKELFQSSVVSSFYPGELGRNIY